MNVSFWVTRFWTSSWPDRNKMSGFGYTDTLLITIHACLVLVFFWDLLTIWRISLDISIKEMLLLCPSVDIINVEETVLTSPVSLSVHRGSSPSCAGSRERCRGWPAAADTVWSPRWSPRCPQLHTHTDIRRKQSHASVSRLLLLIIFLYNLILGCVVVFVCVDLFQELAMWSWGRFFRSRKLNKKRCLWFPYWKFFLIRLLQSAALNNWSTL